MPLYLYFFPSQKLIPDLKDSMLLLILGLFCTVWAFRLSITALKKVSSFTMNLSYNLEPIYSIILAFFLFKENKELSTWFYFGVGLIFLSVILQILKMRQTEKSSSLENAF